jgi:endonuclease/exonuclease/phosphatase family metal-dependent hydrolase
MSVNRTPKHPREIRLLQANLCKNKERTHGILNDPSTKEVTILLLQEQYWSEHTSSSPNHNAWTKYEPTKIPEPGKRPRAATYINKSWIPAAQITQINLPFTDIVATKIITSRDQPALVVVNVYNPSGAESIIRELHTALQTLLTPDQMESDIIIMAGDFNCHHPIWNRATYLRQDTTADRLIDLATDLELTLLLPPGTVTFPRADTTIDLVWGNSMAEKRTLKCQTTTTYDQGSDHLPIETVLKMSLPTTPQEGKYNINKTNWEKFTQHLQRALSQTPIPEKLKTKEEIDDAAEQLVKALQTSFHDSTPLRRHTIHSKRWWTPTLTELSKAQKRLKNRWLRTRRQEDREVWREKANELKHVALR